VQSCAQVSTARKFTGQPLFYACAMSRWDPVPTPSRRWMIRHRRWLLVGAVVVVGLAIGYFVYDLATPGQTVGGVLKPLVAIATSINLVNMTRQSARSIEKYDSTRDQAPHTG
jgi:hypothetical protein